MLSAKAGASARCLPEEEAEAGHVQPGPCSASTPAWTALCCPRGSAFRTRLPPRCSPGGTGSQLVRTRLTG